MMERMQWYIKLFFNRHLPSPSLLLSTTGVDARSRGDGCSSAIILSPGRRSPAPDRRRRAPSISAHTTRQRFVGLSRLNFTRTCKLSSENRLRLKWTSSQGTEPSFFLSHTASFHRFACVRTAAHQKPWRPNSCDGGAWQPLRDDHVGSGFVQRCRGVLGERRTLACFG
jgi:hypothetical protein